MNTSENIDKLIKKLHLKASADLDKRVHEDISRALVEPASPPEIWRTIMKAKTARFAAAAVIALVVIGGITFWPNRGPDGKKWWLGPSAAWGQEILAALDGVKAVTCREQIATVEADGTQHVSKTWDIFYVSRDSYRRDIYDGSILREIQWYVPDGDGTRQHSIRFDLGSYYAHTGPGSFGNYDPVERLRFYVRLLDEADRLLGEDVIDGHQCVGFEISAAKYGDNPSEWMDCIWFDVETKLPVCIEQRCRPVTGQPDKTFTTIQDQFDYNPNVSSDTFVPYTPEGFVFGHPDDIQAAQKATQK
ncbi:MAG: hypothetical protein A2Z25_20635 [Planctomycetes bacterium RBG_16_55_9]|nr:MAG: hypothetical protein A2Z25_20635 [Planctomycetes bacterium RBG_16_55_9]